MAGTVPRPQNGSTSGTPGRPANSMAMWAAAIPIAFG